MDYVNVILTHAIPLVAILLGGVASVLAAWLGKLIAKKLHVQITGEQHELLLDLVDGGITRAEQWAIVKTKIGSPPPAGPDKLNKALTYVEEMARQYKLDVMARDKLVELVESALGDKHSATP